MQPKLASSLDFYNDYTRASQQNLLLRVTSSKPFIVEDLIAAHVIKSPRITFRPNRKSTESENARKYALGLRVGTVFVAKVYLDGDYKKNKGFENDFLWMCFLVSEPVIVVDWVNLVKLHLGSQLVSQQVHALVPPLGYQLGFQPEPQVGYQSGPQVGYQSGPQVGYQPEPQVGYQAGPQVGYQSGSQVVPPGAQLAGAQPGSQAGAQLGFKLDLEPQNLLNQANTEYANANIPNGPNLTGARNVHQVAPIGGATADVWAELQNLKLRLSDQEQKYTEKINDLEQSVNELQQENKRLSSRLKGVGFLIDRRTDDMKKWVNGLLKR